MAAGSSRLTAVDGASAGKIGTGALGGRRGLVHNCWMQHLLHLSCRVEEDVFVTVTVKLRCGLVRWQEWRKRDLARMVKW